MGLTSTALLLVTAAAAVAFFAATVWCWPRLARRAAGPVLGRVGVLLATQLSLISALALLVNSSFGFYASWGDLFGRDRSQGVVVEDPSADAALGNPGADTAEVLSWRPVDMPGASEDPRRVGRTAEVRVTGTLSGIDSLAYVYLPPEYFQPQFHRQTFPATVVLTGYPGTAAALISGLHYPQVALEQERAGRMQPTVLVMLRPTLAPPRDTECVDVPHGPHTETFLARDLPRAIAHRFRVGRHGRSWGVIGDSTGGYCALKLAMSHPHTYAAAAALSGYFKAAQDPTTGDLFGGSARREHAADLFWRLRHRAHPPVSLLVATSRHGEHDYRATMSFVHAVEHAPPTRVSSMVLGTGGHNFTTWDREIPAALAWLSARLTDH
jgi:hypothetical protein